MDGKRMSKKSMQELTQAKGDTLADFIKTYALYKFTLSEDWMPYSILRKGPLNTSKVNNEAHKGVMNLSSDAVGQLSCVCLGGLWRIGGTLVGLSRSGTPLRIEKRVSLFSLRGKLTRSPKF